MDSFILFNSYSFNSFLISKNIVCKDTSLRSLLVQDPVATLSTSDWITGLYFIFSVTFCNDKNENSSEKKCFFGFFMHQHCW